MKRIELRVPAGFELPGAPGRALEIAASVWIPEQGARLALVCLAGGNMNRRYYDLRPPDAGEHPRKPEGSADRIRALAPAPALRGTVSPAEAREDPRGPDGSADRIRALAPAPALRGTVSPAHADESFSFAAQMVARGFVVIALDHLGLGESTRPEDGYALTPEVLVRANAHATDEILARLRSGTLDAQVAAMPALRSLGVGHSMGAMLTVLRQARSRPHAGVALLGFSTRGLPQYLPAEVRTLAQDPAAVRARLVDLASAMFVQPYPRIRSSGNGEAVYGSAKADPRSVAALKAANDVLLPVPAYMSMLPGNVAPEAAQLDVPVFLGLGERDMAGPPHAAQAAFTASPDVSLQLLADTGRSHFLFASRHALFDRLAHWARGYAE